MKATVALANAKMESSENNIDGKLSMVLISPFPDLPVLITSSSHFCHVTHLSKAERLALYYASRGVMRQDRSVMHPLLNAPPSLSCNIGFWAFCTTSLHSWRQFFQSVIWFLTCVLQSQHSFSTQNVVLVRL